jgi:hypothetical protein
VGPAPAAHPGVLKPSDSLRKGRLAPAASRATPACAPERRCRAAAHLVPRGHPGDAAALPRRALSHWHESQRRASVHTGHLIHVDGSGALVTPAQEPAARRRAAPTCRSREPIPSALPQLRTPAPPGDGSLRTTACRHRPDRGPLPPKHRGPGNQARSDVGRTGPMTHAARCCHGESHERARGRVRWAKAARSNCSVVASRRSISPRSFASAARTSGSRNPRLRRAPKVLLYTSMALGSTLSPYALPSA